MRKKERKKERKRDENEWLRDGRGGAEGTKPIDISSLYLSFAFSRSVLYRHRQTERRKEREEETVVK